MTISSGGFNLPSQSFSPTPTHFEKETTALESFKNKAEFGKGNVVITPNTDDIKFTQQNDRNVWNYNSTSSRPLLPPAGQLRGNAPQLSTADEAWKAGYDELTNDLDPELQAELENPTLEETGTLKDVLIVAGRTMNWVDTVSNTIGGENAIARTNANAELPAFANTVALSQVDDIASSLDGTLDEIGPNAPFYQDSKGLVDDAKHFVQERAGGG